MSSRYAPAYSYGLRCGVSLALCLLYLSGSVILGRSPIITGQGARGIDIFYCICLAVLCLFSVVTAQQTFAEGQAAWRIYQRQIARERDDGFDERLELQPAGAPEQSAQHHDNDTGATSWGKPRGEKDRSHQHNYCKVGDAL